MWGYTKSIYSDYMINAAATVWTAKGEESRRGSWTFKEKKKIGLKAKLPHEQCPCWTGDVAHWWCLPNTPSPGLNPLGISFWFGVIKHWQNQFRRARVYSGSQFRITVHRLGKWKRQERPAASHTASTVKKQRANYACVRLSLSLPSPEPTFETVPPTFRLCLPRG